MSRIATALVLLAGVASAEPGHKLDVSALYPVLVPTGYFSGGPAPVVHPLLPGLDVALVEHHAAAGGAGLAGYVREADLAAAGLTRPRAWQLAMQHLEDAAKKELHPHGFAGTDGKPKMILWPDHWLAATCLLLPRLWKMTTTVLKSEHVLIAIPHRDVMVLFADGGEAANRAMVAQIRENEKDGRKPITDKLLRLLPPTGKAFWEKSPVEWY